jgi:hypothetical protein
MFWLYICNYVAIAHFRKIYNLHNKCFKIIIIIICKHCILSTFPYNLFLVKFNVLAKTNFKMSTNLFMFDFIVAKFLVFFNTSLDVSIGF